MSHILVIDADASAAQVTAGLAQRIVPTATIACESTPDHGRRSAQRLLPDVLIIDPSPYGPKGVLLIEMCKQQNPNLRIIVLASTIAPGLRRQIQDSGVHVYLQKPVASALLVEQIRNGLNPSPVVGSAAL